MSQLPTIQTLQNTDYPHPNDLYPYAVGIRYSDSKGNEKTLGSGVLYSDNDSFRVLTARHCLIEDGGTWICLNDVFFNFAMNNQRTFKAINIILDREDLDLAVMEVDFKPMPYQEAYYKGSPMFIGEPFSKHTNTYGFSKSYPSGTRIDVKYVAPKTYRSIEGIFASGRDLEMLRGFSGSGIFTKAGNKIICEGFIKSKFDSVERLEEIEVETIPDLGSKIWIERYNPEMAQDPYMSSGSNTAKIEYIAAWSNLAHAINSGQDCSAGLQCVIEKRKAYHLPKSGAHQERIIWELFRKKENWNKQEQDAFLWALTDLGQWPALYGDMPEKAGNITKNPLCLPLLHREATMSCDEDLEPMGLNIDLDSDIYESILRALFVLDFARAIDICTDWNPKKEIFLSKKLMLLHLLNQKDDDLSNLVDKRITEKPDGIEIAFIDTVIANQCDFQIPAKYSYEGFNRAGLDSPGEVLESFLNKIDKTIEKLSVYGTHTTQLIDNVDTSSFPAALRVINYLIESGIPTTEGFVWTVSTQNRFKVFRHLFRNFPYPALFYSLLYRDEKLLRRIGQEMAYTDCTAFRNQLPDIITRLLKALVSDSTPNGMIFSIFQVTGELFPSIESDIWIDEFHSALKYYFEHLNLKNVSYRDDFYKFVCKGLGALRKYEEKIRMLTLISEFYSQNPILFNYIIVNGLHFTNTELIDNRFESSIDKIIIGNQFSQSNLLIAYLSHHNMLSDKQEAIITEKIETEGIDFATRNKETLHNLTFVVSEKRIPALKELILALNIWDCGISGTSFSSVDDFEIEHISNKIKWTVEEQDRIIDNLNDNLTKIESVEDSKRLSGFLKGCTTRLLSRMHRYLTWDELSPSTKDIPALTKRVELELSKWTHAESIMENLVSDNYNQISNTLHDIVHQAKINGISSIHREVNLIIDRALTQHKTALAPIINVLSVLVSEYSDNMIDSFGSSLLLLLKRYNKYDYEELDLPVPFVNKQLIAMAKILKRYFPDNQAAEYWCSEEMQNRFCMNVE